MKNTDDQKLTGAAKSWARRRMQARDKQGDARLPNDASRRLGTSLPAVARSDAMGSVPAHG